MRQFCKKEAESENLNFILQFLFYIEKRYQKTEEEYLKSQKKKGKGDQSLKKGNNMKNHKGLNKSK